jgi:SAM-dependent methyltransferase
LSRYGSRSTISAEKYVAVALTTLRDTAPDESTKAIINLFRGERYVQINGRRLEHLAALRLPLFGRSVLEVGAGIGDLATFFIDRDCTVTLTDGRRENLDVLRSLHPHAKAFLLDLDDPDLSFRERYDIVFCYGTLYHLAHPAQAIAYMAERCKEMLLLETCVSLGEGRSVRQVVERSAPDQALAGIGSRPTRAWVRDQLRRRFEFVYLPRAQPADPEFPTDWTRKPQCDRTRAIFVAFRSPLNNPLLTTSIPEHQERV